MTGTELIRVDSVDEFKVEYEILSGISSKEKPGYEKSIEQIDAEIAEIDNYIEKLNIEIDRL